MRFAITLVPLAVALGTLPLIENTNLLMRPLLALTMLASILAFRERPQGAEVTWLGLLFFYCFSFGLSAAYSVSPELASVNVWRQAFIMLLAVATLVLFRDGEVRRTGLRSCMIIMLVSFAATAWVYLMLVPTYGIGYEAAREIKGVALEDYRIGLNTLSFLAVISMLAFMMSFKTSMGTKLMVFFAVVVCVFALGSRATILALAIAWFVFFIIRAMWRSSPLLGLLAIPLLIGLSVIAWLMVADYAVEIRDVLGAEVLREISVGRTDMWLAGLSMLEQRPLFGWGPESWKILMLEFLPGANDHTLTVIMNLTSGSFHNGFIAVAAERGGIGLLAAVSMQAYLFWCSAQIYMRRALYDDADRQAAELMPLLVLFMFLRGLAESSGLFGNANSEVDYLTYFIASYVVAMHQTGIRLEQSHASFDAAYEADELQATPPNPA